MMAAVPTSTPGKGRVAPKYIETNYAYVSPPYAGELKSALIAGNNLTTGGVYNIFLTRGVFYIADDFPHITKKFAIYGDNTTFVINRPFSWNDALAYGGLLKNNGGKLKIFDSVFKNGYAINGGGAIVNTGGTLEMTRVIYLSRQSGRRWRFGSK
jgi:hypothetical protein